MTEKVLSLQMHLWTGVLTFCGKDLSLAVALVRGEGGGVWLSYLYFTSDRTRVNGAGRGRSHKCPPVTI